MFLSKWIKDIHLFLKSDFFQKSFSKTKLVLEKFSNLTLQDKSDKN